MEREKGRGRGSVREQPAKAELEAEGEKRRTRGAKPAVAFSPDARDLRPTHADDDYLFINTLSLSLFFPSSHVMIANLTHSPAALHQDSGLTGTPLALSLGCLDCETRLAPSVRLLHPCTLAPAVLSPSSLNPFLLSCFDGLTPPHFHSFSLSRLPSAPSSLLVVRSVSRFHSHASPPLPLSRTLESSFAFLCLSLSVPRFWRVTQLQLN